MHIGETIFIPSGWCHAVKNLKPTVCYGAGLMYPRDLIDSMMYCAHINTNPHNPEAMPYHHFPQIIDGAKKALKSQPKDEYFPSFGSELVQHWDHIFNRINNHIKKGYLK